MSRLVGASAGSPPAVPRTGRGNAIVGAGGSRPEQQSRQCVRTNSIARKTVDMSASQMCRNVATVWVECASLSLGSLKFALRGGRSPRRLSGRLAARRGRAAPPPASLRLPRLGRGGPGWGGASRPATRNRRRGRRAAAAAALEENMFRQCAFHRASARLRADASCRAREILGPTAARSTVARVRWRDVPAAGWARPAARRSGGLKHRRRGAVERFAAGRGAGASAAAGAGWRRASKLPLDFAFDEVASLRAPAR